MALITSYRASERNNRRPQQYYTSVYCFQVRQQKLTLLTKVVNWKMILNLQILFPTWVPRSPKNKLFNSPEDSMRNLPTFRDATVSFPAKRRLRNEHRKFILIDDMSLPRSGKCFSLVKVNFYPIRSTTQV